MGIGIHIYFNTLKLLYSCIYRRELKFCGLEILSSLIIILIATFFDRTFYNHIVSSSNIPKGINFFIYATIYGLLFIGLSLLTRFLLKKNPEEVAAVKNNNKVIPVGIIDFTWIVMLGLVYAGIIFCNEFDVLSAKIKAVNNLEYYKFYYDEVQYLFNQTINIFLVLGTILAACMTIIWSGAIWRKRDHTSRKQYQSTTMASIKIVIAFFIIVAAIIIWISLPMYLKMTGIKEQILNYVA